MTDTLAGISSESASIVKTNENAEDSIEDAEEIPESPAKVKDLSSKYNSNI